MNPTLLVLELGAAVLFVTAAVLALRRGRLPVLELLSAASFGLLLEEGDQLIFQTYHYSSDFVLAIDRAPLLIGLTWALIIAGAMRITDALGVRRRWAPFTDSVLAISLDLAFDAVAIRMGLWTWLGVGASDGWFGVPAGNFYAWLFVTLAFSWMTRLVRDRAADRPHLEWLQLLVPLPAFAILLASLVPFSLLLPIVDPAPGGGLGMFAIAFVAFLATAAWGVWGRGRHVGNGARLAIVDLRLAFASRLAIHGVFLVALFALGIPAQTPMLLVTAVALLALELPLAMIVASRQPRDSHAAVVEHSEQRDRRPALP